MTKTEKYRYWDSIFGWPIKWKNQWPKRRGFYYLRDARVEMDDPDMPF